MTGKDSFCYSFAINDHEELKSNEQNLMTAWIPGKIYRMSYNSHFIFTCGG
jgi:hypothetical protein